MEAADLGSGQSGSSTANRSTIHQPPLRQYQPPPNRDSRDSRDAPLERTHREPSVMATATLLHPTAAPYPGPSSYSAGYSQPGSSMISASDARRPPEDNDPSKRQSLPSISEVISNTKSSAYHPPAPSSAQPNNSFPSPFTGPPRSYGEAEKHPSPQTHRPATSYPTAREPLTSFADSPRNSFNGRPGLPPVSDRRPSPSAKPEHSHHHYSHDSHRDSAVNGGYPHPPAPAPSNSAYPIAPLPHGQMPLPSYPPSPRHPTHPSHSSHSSHPYAPYEQRGQSGPIDGGDRVARPPYEPSGVTSPWNYGEALSRLAQTSRTLFTFAEAYARIAHEQHGAHTIPERLPTEQEVADMFANVEYTRLALEKVKEAVQLSIRNERAREAPKPKATYEEEHDVPMFEDGMKSQYAITEVKKRRGRAAPPGRCHSCNRVDTPEWRRGPDGARTLCNACGLHYAKLERKRQLEQRNIRPKPEDRN